MNPVAAKVLRNWNLHRENPGACTVSQALSPFKLHPLHPSVMN
jgi:hypothetical protein